MKKTLFLLTVLCTLLYACNPLKPHSSLAVTSGFEKGDSIPASLALAMITHYMSDTIQVNHNADAIIREVTLYNSDLYKIFKMKTVTALKLWDAAYLDTDPIVAQRNQTTVILEVKQGYMSTLSYYDLKKAGTGRLCPPPYGCTP